MALVDVLIPTYGRKTGLAMVLTSLLGQTFRDFNVIVSDQTAGEDGYLESAEIQTIVQALRLHGHEITLHHHVPRRGMAEQRQFLFEQSNAAYIQFIDDDILLEPQVMQRMVDVIQEERCGFVGCAAIGLQFQQDVRPHQQHIELWNGPVSPERFHAQSIPWERHLVNNAANALHLEHKLVRNGRTLRYKVAWVGGANVLFDREKLRRVGAFSWWQHLPPEHAGEEVVVQFLLLNEYGGCGILPSGTYHIGLPTTIEDRQRNATELFDELLKELQHERTYS
jgi:glycosyltransferase involved in cell wall biosynthesis